MKLADIAHIQSGTAFTKKPVQDNKGDFYVLDSAAIVEGVVAPEKMVRASTRQPGLRLPQKEVLPGDILLKSKGGSRLAVVFDFPRQDLPVFPSSLFHMISLHEGVGFDPHFISWVINSNQIQSFLGDRAKGSTVSHFPLAVTKDIEIPEVSIDKQMKLVRLGVTFNRQEMLMQKLMFAKQKYRAAFMNEQIWGSDSE